MGMQVKITPKPSVAPKIMALTKSSALFTKSTLLGSLLKFIFPVKVSVHPGVQALFLGILVAIWWRILYRLGKYLENTVTAVYLFIIEHKRIKKLPLSKILLYSFTWPTFDIIGRYTQYVALFKKVDWKPIPHKSKVTIEDLHKSDEKEKQKTTV